jgi:3-hydroxy-9,10-secoandrosta-1,3,5(10)-triene-9,17-dione monooxygenase
MFVTGPGIVPEYNGMLISREEAIERAKTIGIIAKKNADETETLGRMPQENVAAIVDSGLMPLLRPSEFGGFDGDWMTHIDCISEVARYCGSTAWCMSFLLQHQFFLALFPIECQREVYARNPDPKVATSFAATGTVTAVPGGYELSGTWKFASGSDHCDWALVGGKDPGGTDGVFNYLLSPGQFRVNRVWDAIGLSGTGSNDIVVDAPVFVPAHYRFSNSEAMAGRAPGPRHLKAPLFRAPLAYNSGFGVMAPVHGIARGLYETLVSFKTGQKAHQGTVSASETSDVQSTIGLAKAEIDLAHLLTQKMAASAVSPKPVTVEDIMRVRRDFVLLRDILRQAVDRLFAISGARGLTRSLPIQRQWRDFHAIAHHFAFSTPSYQTAGRFALGMDPAPGDILTSFSEDMLSAHSGMD